MSVRNLTILAVTLLFAAPQMPHQGRPEGRGPGFRGMLLRHMDKDKDGRISQEEYNQFFLDLFEKWDADKDGFATREEVRQFAMHMGRRMMWRRMDTNGDGKISRDEWRGRPEVFDRLDKNNDGVLTPDELKAPKRDFRSLDKDGDGKLSPKELDVPEEVFRRLDKNEDGFVDEQEWKQAHSRRMGRQHGMGMMGQHMGPPRGGKSHGDGMCPQKGMMGREHGNRMGPMHGMRGRGPMGPHRGPMMGMRLFDRLDRDKDGRVSRSEVEAFVRESFARLDRNGDGYLDKQDRPRGPRMMPSVPEGEEEPFVLP